MKFTLNAPERSHGIRVIESIPDLSLCQVEGLNGVGKTLALHLLELCTGRQPYAARSSAWRTLCQYLGPAEITVEGLRANAIGDTASARTQTLRFAFDWRDRAQSDVPLNITADLFDEITLDGEPIQDFDAVRETLAVERIAGDETLIETIAALVATDRERLRAATRVARERGAYGDRVLGGMTAHFSPDPARVALGTAEELQGVLGRVRELENSREEQRQLLERLEEAAQIYAAVGDISANADSLRAEIERLHQEYADAQERSRQAAEKLEAAREKEKVSEELQKELQTAQRSFTRRLGAVKRADEDIEKRATGLGVGVEADAIAKARQDIERERSELAQKRADMKDIFALRDLLEGLIRALAPAASGGLGARTVATIGGQSLTAGDLLAALRQRRERLLGDAPVVEELDERLAVLEARDRALVELADALADRATKHEALEQAERTLEKLGADEDETGESVAECAAARASAQRIEIDVASALGAAERQLAQLAGGVSLQDLEAKLEHLLTEAEATRATLQDELRVARVEIARLDDELDKALARRDELEATAADLRRALVKQAQELRAGERHARLRAILADRAPDPAHDLVDLARAWVAVHDAEERAVRRLQAAAAPLTRVGADMDDLVAGIRRGDAPSPELDPIRKHYEARLLDQFGHSEIVAALFDSGELLRVDLAAREVRWRTDAGEPRIRPFEAFSSGERAFAYVQARLAAASELEARNRVVAIDEFGAFLSRDRLARLQESVERQVEQGVIHQAIVVLPLSRPLEEGEPEYVTGVFDPVARV